jgi:hypothetical protein
MSPHRKIARYLGIRGAAAVRRHPGAHRLGRYPRTQRPAPGLPLRATACDGIAVDSPAHTRDVTVSFARAGAIFELEANLGLTADQTTTISGLHLFTPEPDMGMRGKELRGPTAPEGVIEGAPVDRYHCTGTSDTDPAIGTWEHTGPRGTTGWRKLPYG